MSWQPCVGTHLFLLSNDEGNSSNRSCRLHVYRRLYAIAVKHRTVHQWISKTHIEARKETELLCMYVINAGIIYVHYIFEHCGDLFEQF